MEESIKERMKELTTQLIKYNNQAHQQFVKRTKTEEYQVDFYQEVKPFADEVREVVDEWKPLVLQWIQEEKPKYIYFPQINDTYDNITITSVTAWQKDTRQRRFIRTIKSIDYVLESILNQL